MGLDKWKKEPADRDRQRQAESDGHGLIVPTTVDGRTIASKKLGLNRT